MNTIERLNQIEKINISTIDVNSYSLVSTFNENTYYGKNYSGNIVFVIRPLKTNNNKRYKLTTNDLILEVNVESEFSINDKSEKLLAHILTCSSDNPNNHVAFVRLCEAFNDSDLVKDEDIIKLFNTFVSLFSDKAKSSSNELQGLFAELYTMHFFESKGINLYQFWQSEDKRKHDFYISYKKRIEVKSTSKDLRIHHFLHEQLLAELHDVKVVSLITKKTDLGLSLYDVVSLIRISPLSSYKLLLHIEQKLRNCSIEEQKLIVFDEQLLQHQLKIFDAKDIPHFNEKQPDGVFNAEYDSDLTNAKEFSINEFLLWLKSHAV